MPLALLPCWICLLVAGWLLRKPERAEWRAEWLGEVWERWQGLSLRHEWNGQSAWQLYVTGVGCFRDAWGLFVVEEDRWPALRSTLRTPMFGAFVLGAGVLVLALSSHYFSAARIILSPLPYKSGDRLAIVTRTGRLQSIRQGIPANIAELWRREGKLLEGMAACSIVQEAGVVIGGRTFNATSLRASDNLLDLIGVRAPRQTGEPVVWLSYSFWQRELHSDPKVIGKQFQHGAGGLRIAGVLPADFWLLSPAIQVIEAGAVPAAGQGSFLLVKAKPEVSAHELENELLMVAERNEMPFLETAPHVLFLSEALRAPLWLFGGALLIAAVAVGLGRGSRLRRQDRTNGRLPFGNGRWWAFLFVKTAAALALVFLTGIEMFSGMSRPFTTDPLGGPALLWFYTAACSLVLLAVIADQQARCRVCLRCLAFPIRVGCPGCLFLDWSGTELLCPDGHGMLYVPHHVSCWDEAERWVAMEI